MKRRNADPGKLRRPLKRSKITEGIYGSSTFLYVKFLIVWILVLMADFILDFRFEYLWPFWLLLRSVYDSFKYQGLAFSVFFVCIAITSDVICYLVIPVQWLFFAASTYVWVQYVWHTERGICLPTVSLWLLCVYIEASVRLRHVKSLPYHMDLCRPFAAHCIGYPVVTLGFGFKSYVSYRLRMRKQKEVEKENDFYVHLLQQALPADPPKALQPKSQEDVISNGTGNTFNQLPHKDTSSGAGTASATAASSSTANSSVSAGNSSKNKATNVSSGGSSQNDTRKDSKKGGGGGGGIGSSSNIEDIYLEQHKKTTHSVNDFDEEANENTKTFKVSNGVGHRGTKLNSSRDTKEKDSREKKSKNNNTASSSTTTQQYSNNKEEVIVRMESDIKRLKADLQSSRNCEQELRSQINNYVIGDKSMKSELYQLRQDNESLQTKLHNLVTNRQQDKQALSILERKLTDLRKEKTTLETQLATERRAKKAEEATAARAVAMAAAARGECNESCKSRRRDQETAMKQIQRELELSKDQIRQMERETKALRQYKDVQNETDVLMSALAAMQDKNSHLENSLSSETRVKLDLFSALGEAKRQIEIQQNMLSGKELEIADLKSKMAEVLALLPTTGTSFSAAATPTTSLPSPHFSSDFASPVCTPTSMLDGSGAEGADNTVLNTSLLNPNASDYTPKLSP